jgi:hypothetical protein
MKPDYAQASVNEFILTHAKRGGTYLYCLETDCKFKTRRAKRYRRHWRHRHVRLSAKEGTFRAASRVRDRQVSDRQM